MPINIAFFLRFTFIQIFRSSGTNMRLTPQRRKAMLLWYLVIPIHQILTLISYYLDEIFFGAYRRQEIKAPVFVVGNFRSGSSLLQRLLARDGRRLGSVPRSASNARFSLLFFTRRGNGSTSPQLEFIGWKRPGAASRR